MGKQLTKYLQNMLIILIIMIDLFYLLKKKNKNPSGTFRDEKGLYAEVYDMDSIYCIIDKKNCSVFETKRREVFANVCDSLNVGLKLNVD